MDELLIGNKKIGSDDAGNICLNDIWSLAGSPSAGRPVDWKKRKSSQALEEALRERMVQNLHHLTKDAEVTTGYVAGKGRGARSYAHPVLALDYAEFLSPALGVEIREIFLRYRADDISLANEILDRVAEQVREDEMRLHIREEISVRNKELAGQGKKAGCTGWQYAELHNSGYRGLYNGLDEDGIHRLKKLTKNQKILDHMTAAEGAANLFRITQAKIAMQSKMPSTSPASL